MPQQQMKTGTLFRTLTLDREAANSDERTIELSFSSEEAVERWFGREILDHSPKAVRLDRLKSRGPLLLDHDSRDQIGVVEKVSIGKDRIGRATVRFGKSARAEEIFQDVLDGIRGNVSVGYQIHRMVLEEEDEQRGNTYRALDWEPLEVSLVSIPADTSVGIGREAEGDHKTIIDIPQKENRKMPEKNPESAAPAVDVKKIESEARSAELARIREITAIGDKFGKTDLARQFVDNGRDVAAFRAAVLETMGDAKPLDVPSPVDMQFNEKEDREYSVVRALRAVATGDWGSAGFEREVSQEIAKKLGRSSEGVFVPTGLQLRAPMSAGTSADGGYTVQTTVMPLIEMLRNRMMVKRLGAQVLSGLEGSLGFPKQLTSPTLNWTSENPGSDTGEFDATGAFGQVLMSPKTAIATVPYSKQLLAQSTMDIEQFVRNDLSRVNALGLDLAAIAGTGANGQPTGILNTTGVGLVEIGATGGAPTDAHIIDLETAVAIDNADLGSLAYLTNAKVRGKLKKTDKGTDTGQRVWNDGSEAGFGMLNGYRAAVSNQVPGDLTKSTGTDLSAILFGNWDDLIIGEWGVLELLADPYRLKKQGLVEITSFMLVDLIVRHAESFAAIKDADTV